MEIILLILLFALFVFRFVNIALIGVKRDKKYVQYFVIFLQERKVMLCDIDTISW